MVQPTGFDSRDEQSDRALRPKRLAEFTGQLAVTRNLSLAIAAATQRQEQLDHVLLSGPPGLGKTTLAHIMAAEMGCEIRETSGPLIDKPGDLAGILSGLRPGALLFIDEIHSLKRVVEEYLYAAMEDFRIAIQLGEGATTQTLTLTLPPFTLVGATTREGQLSAPFRSRFAIRERLDLYSVAELELILARSASLLHVDADAGGLATLARRSRGTARYANNHLRRVRDLAQVRYGNRISQAVADEGLAMLGIDAAGLTEIDRRILGCLAQHRRPVGLKTVAVTVGEEEATIEDIYEPFLIQSGYLVKTPTGRVVTVRAYQHLGLAPPATAGRGEGEQQFIS
jgi:Holliday junction DNA helicase RuvB